jgi:8-oxo-dGTP pyrophosphatase MutT (NUDIX family)
MIRHGHITTPAFFDERSFRRQAEAGLRPAPLAVEEAGASPSDYDLNPGYPAPAPHTLKPAAVLVPVIAGPDLRVLLTERTQELPDHAGQIAFPGGKIDPGETSLAAALREANEEIGLDAAYVEPLGFLDPYRTGTGYLVTPAVALIRPGYRLSPNPREVARVFDVPLAFLLDSANHRIDSRFWRGAERHYYAMPFGEHYIWGVTAGIIKALQRSLIGT